MHIYAQFWAFWRIMTRKVGQTELVFDVRSGSLAGLCMQDYKSLDTITMVNIQTDIQTAFRSPHVNSSAS